MIGGKGDACAEGRKGERGELGIALTLHVCVLLKKWLDTTTYPYVSFE